MTDQHFFKWPAGGDSSWLKKETWLHNRFALNWCSQEIFSWCYCCFTLFHISFNTAGCSFWKLWSHLEGNWDESRISLWLPWGGQIRTIYLGFIFTYTNKRQLNVFYFLKNQNTAFINSDQSQQPNSDWPMPVRRKSLNATNAFFTERRKLQKNNGQNSACFIFVITF